MNYIRNPDSRSILNLFPRPRDCRTVKKRVSQVVGVRCVLMVKRTNIKSYSPGREKMMAAGMMIFFDPNQMGVFVNRIIVHPDRAPVVYRQTLS
ncbi:MAG: hypothetical protein GY864_07540 [Desulfobacterales bacterium]|nr:hypothetical protein [Desulfobacterales bacterium]